jgi:hypothetical protein
MNSGFSPAERDIYAVLDSADSDLPVEAPADRTEAWRLKSGHTFHCSTALGGCGTELTFAIGEINRPHFRHRAGVRCALMGSGSVADRYTHLAIQNALHDWINGMPGFTCRLEVAVEEGRTDVLATGPGLEAALEVQRSQLADRLLVMEYDGAYWHSAPAKVVTDVRKTTDLLEAGHLVVRLREDDLPPLGIDHPHYNEVRVYSTAPNPGKAMDEIAEWLDGLGSVER